MKNSKITRLILGLIILFSFFIFQGSDSEDSCNDCSVANNTGSLIVINQSFSQLSIKVFITGPETKSATIQFGSSMDFNLEPGTYNVVSKDTGFSDVITGAKQVVIVKDGTKTITFN